MDSKYSFENLNYSGIVDVPTLTISSPSITVRNYKANYPSGTPVRTSENTIRPLQRDNGGVVFQDSTGKPVYYDNGWKISVNGTPLPIESEYDDELGIAKSWYTLGSGDRVYLEDGFGHFLPYSDYATLLSKYKVSDAMFSMRHQDGTEIFSNIRGTLSISGNSSATASGSLIVKKSFKMKFDTNVSIGGWGEHRDYAIKGYFSDWTNTKDIVCQKLFEQMLIMDGVRPNGNPVSDTTALCHTDGFPVRVVFKDSTNTEYYWGLYVFQTRKKRSTFGMNKNNLSQIAFEKNIGFEWMINELINPDDDATNYDLLKDELTRFSRITYTDSDKVDEEQHAAVTETLNVRNYLDTYLLQYLVYNWDAYTHNTIYATWDAEWDASEDHIVNTPKYYTIPYDMDMTFGIGNIEGSGSSGKYSQGNYYLQSRGVMPLINAFVGETSRTYQNWEAFRAMAKGRYKRLRGEGIFSVENITELLRKLYLQTTGLPNSGEIYSQNPELFGMTGGEVDPNDPNHELIHDTLYQDQSTWDFYREDKVRWGWYRMYHANIQPNQTLYCAGVCNYFKGRETISRAETWIADKLAEADNLFEYSSGGSTRRLTFNNTTVESVGYDTKTANIVRYGGSEVYSI